MHKKRKIFKTFRTLTIIGLIVLVLGAFSIVLLSPPPIDFVPHSQVRIEKNSSLSEIALLLKEKKIIYSPFLFKMSVKLMGGEKSIPAEDYYFDQRESVWTIASRLVKGDQGIKKIKITIPEGVNATEIAGIIKKSLPDFDTELFIKSAMADEGYLFPDTYYFLPFAKIEEIISTMRENFNTKINELSALVWKSKRKLSDIVTMASILEKEVNTTETRQTVAGILWKRLDDEMLLQVDVAPKTYKEKGLPEKPITNPGFDAIKDALNPIDTKYWYYLSDDTGKIHYAMDYEAHLKNIEKYLR